MISLIIVIYYYMQSWLSKLKNFLLSFFISTKNFKNDFDKARYFLSINNKYATYYEIKQSYYKLRRIVQNPSQLMNINWGYNYLVNNIEIELYNSDNIINYKDDFYDKISRIYLNHKKPDNRNFYIFWKTINIKDKYVEKKVKYLTNVLKTKTTINQKNTLPNESINLFNNINTKISLSTNIIPNKKIPKFKCELCNKNYNSIKTLTTHQQSKKHLMKLNIKFYSASIGPTLIHTPLQLPKKSIISPQDVNDTIKVKKINFKSEHVLFRTCYMCNKEFQNRIDLIKHIQLHNLNKHSSYNFIYFYYP